MTLQEAIERAQKLLRLSQSDNPNEAAAALAQAQKILTKYGIEQAMLEEGDPTDKEEVAREELDRSSPFNMDTWKRALSGIIAEMNSCKAFVAPNNAYCAIVVIGRPSDIQKVRYLFTYFTNEVNRLCDRECKGRGRTYRNNFRHGIVDTLSVMLFQAEKEARRDAAGTSAGDRALVRVDARKNDVALFVKNNLRLQTKKAAPMQSDWDARAHGRVAGQEIGLTQARGALK